MALQCRQFMYYGFLLVSKYMYHVTCKYLKCIQVPNYSKLQYPFVFSKSIIDRFKGLKTLDLQNLTNGARISREALIEVSKRPQLRELYLSRQFSQDIFWPLIIEHPYIHLEELSMSVKEHTAVYCGIGLMTNLKSLSLLLDHATSAKDLSDLSTLTNLKKMYLRINEMENADNEVKFSHWVTNLKNLEHWRFSYCDFYTNENADFSIGLKYLTKVTTLSIELDTQDNWNDGLMSELLSVRDRNLNVTFYFKDIKPEWLQLFKDFLEQLRGSDINLLLKVPFKSSFSLLFDKLVQLKEDYQFDLEQHEAYYYPF